MAGGRDDNDVVGGCGPHGEQVVSGTGRAAWRGMVAAVDLIGTALLLFVAVVALLVTVFDALGRVLVAAVAAIARAPWRGGQSIRSRVHDDTPS